MDEIPFFDSKPKKTEKNLKKLIENNEYFFKNLVESTSLFPANISHNKHNKPTPNISHNLNVKSQAKPSNLYNLYQKISSNESEKSSVLDENFQLSPSKINEFKFMKFKTLKDFLNRNNLLSEGAFELNHQDPIKPNLNDSSFNKNTKNLNKSNIEKNLFKEFLQNESFNIGGKGKQREDFRRFLKERTGQIHRKMNEISFKSKQTNNDSFMSESKEKNSFSLGNAKNLVWNESFNNKLIEEDSLPKFAFENLKKKQEFENKNTDHNSINTQNYQIINYKENQFQTKPLEYFLKMIEENKKDENLQEKSDGNKENKLNTTFTKNKSKLFLDLKKPHHYQNKKILDFLNNYKEIPNSNNSSHSLKASISKKRKEFHQDLDRNFFRNEDIVLGSSILLGDTDLNTSRTMRTFEERRSISNRNRKMKSTAYRYKNMIENMIFNKKIQTSVLNLSMNNTNVSEIDNKKPARALKEISNIKENEEDFPLNSLYRKLKGEFDHVKMELTDEMFEEYERTLCEEEKLKEIHKEFQNELENEKALEEEKAFEREKGLALEKEKALHVLNQNVEESEEENQEVRINKVNFKGKIEENEKKNNIDDKIEEEQTEGLKETKETNEKEEIYFDKFDSVKNKLMSFWDSNTNSESNESKNHKINKIQEKLQNLKNALNKPKENQGPLKIPTAILLKENTYNEKKDNDMVENIIQIEKINPPKPKRQFSLNLNKEKSQMNQEKNLPLLTKNLIIEEKHKEKEIFQQVSQLDIVKSKKNLVNEKIIKENDVFQQLSDLDIENFKNKNKNEEKNHEKEIFSELDSEKSRKKFLTKEKSNEIKIFEEFSHFDTKKSTKNLINNGKTEISQLDFEKPIKKYINDEKSNEKVGFQQFSSIKNGINNESELFDHMSHLDSCKKPLDFLLKTEKNNKEIEKIIQKKPKFVVFSPITPMEMLKPISYLDSHRKLYDQKEELNEINTSKDKLLTFTPLKHTNLNENSSEKNLDFQNNEFESQNKQSDFNEIENFIMKSNEKPSFERNTLMNSQVKECQTEKSYDFIEKMKLYKMDIGLITKSKFADYQELNEEEDCKNKMLVNRIFFH